MEHDDQEIWKEILERVVRMESMIEMSMGDRDVQQRHSTEITELQGQNKYQQKQIDEIRADIKKVVWLVLSTVIGAILALVIASTR